MARPVYTENFLVGTANVIGTGANLIFWSPPADTNTYVLRHVQWNWFLETTTDPLDVGGVVIASSVSGHTAVTLVNLIFARGGPSPQPEAFEWEGRLVVEHDLFLVASINSHSVSRIDMGVIATGYKLLGP